MSKVNPLKFRIHPDFRDLLIKIQDSRIKSGKETTQEKIALWRLTKTISNMINSNKDMLNKLVEVDIDVKY